MYKLVQGQILSEVSPRIYDVMQLPDGYIMKSCRFPQVIANQTKPSVGSIVMVASEDMFKSYILAVLRESPEFVQAANDLRGGDPLIPLQSGEIHLESKGDPDSPRPGSGSTFFLGNDGTASIYSGSRKESLVIGGTDDDTDAEVLLTGDNGFFESNPNDVTLVQSSYRFDAENNLTLGNHLVTIVQPIVEVPIGQLEIDTLGTILIHNFIGGVENGALKIDTTGLVKMNNLLASLTFAVSGQVTLQNQIASLTFLPSGQLSVSNASSSISSTPSGAIAVTGTTVNLNSGSLGVARLADTTLSSIATDPTWWTFWATLATLIGSLPTTPLDGGATLKAGLAALFATIPLTITAKISSASVSVTAGN